MALLTKAKQNCVSRLIRFPPRMFFLTFVFAARRWILPQTGTKSARVYQNTRLRERNNLHRLPDGINDNCNCVAEWNAGDNEYHSSPHTLFSAHRKYLPQVVLRVSTLRSAQHEVTTPHAQKHKHATQCQPCSTPLNCHRMHASHDERTKRRHHPKGGQQVSHKKPPAYS